jgi:hypothetical protein
MPFARLSSLALCHNKRSASQSTSSSSSLAAPSTATPPPSSTTIALASSPRYTSIANSSGNNASSTTSFINVVTSETMRRHIGKRSIQARICFLHSYATIVLTFLFRYNASSSSSIVQRCVAERVHWLARRSRCAVSAPCCIWCEQLAVSIEF